MARRLILMANFVHFALGRGERGLGERDVIESAANTAHDVLTLYIGSRGDQSHDESASRMAD